MRSERVPSSKRVQTTGPDRRQAPKPPSWLLLMSRTKGLSPKAFERLAWKLYLGSLAAAFVLGGAQPAAAAEKLTDSELMAILSGKADMRVLVSRESADKPKAPETAKVAPVSPIGRAPAKVLELDTADPADFEMEGEVKKLQGVVSAYTHNGIAVEYDGGASEMWLRFTKSVKFTGYGYKKYTDVQIDDRVKATYKEAPGGVKRVLLGVMLLSRKPKEQKVESETLVTEAAEEADAAQ